MTKPDRPLNLDLGRAPFEIVLDLPDLLSNMNRESWQRVKALVVACSDWTLDELGQLDVREVIELSRMLASAKLDEETLAVPPAIADGSNAGPPASGRPRAGRKS